VGLAALCEEEGVVAEAARSVKVVGNLPFSVRSIAILHPRVPLRGSCLSPVVQL